MRAFLGIGSTDIGSIFRNRLYRHRLKDTGFRIFEPKSMGHGIKFKPTVV
jgi:hypothetical protein